MWGRAYSALSLLGASLVTFAGKGRPLGRLVKDART